jgi:hypothetical protein
MILLIAPYKERLGVVVVDASSSGPEAACIGSLQHDKEYYGINWYFNAR